MAFARSGLYQVGPGGSGPRIWSYSTTDAIATVNTSGYFDDANVELSVRDLIFVFDTNTPTTNMVSVLSISAAGVVDVSDGTAIAETDGD